MKTLNNYDQLVKSFDIEKFLKDNNIQSEVKTTYIVIRSCFGCKKQNKMLLNREEKFFKCFVCNEKGNLVKFISSVLDISLSQAYLYIVNKPVFTKSKKLQKNKVVSDTGMKLLPEIQMPYFFKKINLKDNSDVSYYLSKVRGYDQELVDIFNIRYAEAYKRVVFPIYDDMSRLVGFQARDITGLDSVKILTQPTGFKKSQVLYNFNRVKYEDSVVLVEGPVDCHKSYQFNSVALLGKSISKEQAYLLTSMASLKTIYIGLDPDASKQISELISEFCPFFEVKVVQLPKEVKDLGECSVEQANYYIKNSTNFKNIYGKLTSCLIH